MKTEELGRYVCVVHGGCLHSPHITITSNGVWVKWGQIFSSAHRDCFDAWQTRESTDKKRGIVHVSSHHPQTGGADGGPYLSGRELERVDTAQREWMAAGYGVAPVPEDGREHALDAPCPLCGPASQP